ncbi:islet cell autoantigen 1-like protein [Macrosteles quadrilineatus]|uniref:islet cell autoantigen 1-like protein n=1 Tax=Macrosteles quadrilineatus TaxID=74068 RepID=UPI0023E163B1|nr:islet cell autoantigen 1-like protein [Macrosteles quadrilineatus]
MNGPRSRSAAHGDPLGRWADHHSHRQNSTVSKMQYHFWVTKQTVSRKLGKKEDDCIVASDAELDAKLELFLSIQLSCAQLLKILDEYQKKSNSLAYEENSMGRFLKESAKLDDKTEAGKMMAVVGKTLSTTGQQRLAFQDPLRALQKKVESFQAHAIADTFHTIQEMEKTRTKYRAVLNWMKDVSKQLDPENLSLMDKHRKVQDHVKQSRAEFERQKLDCLQKVDLLAAARCNMFSRELIQYENTLKTFATKCVTMFNNISTTFPSHPQYKFSDVKELVEEEKPAKIETDENDDTLLSLDESEADTVVRKVEEVEGSKEVRKSESSENGEGVLLADLLTDALPDNQLLPSQLLAQLSTESSFSSQFPPPAPSNQPLLMSSLSNNNQPKMPIRSLDQVPNKPWLDLFAELDPLSDPDAIDKKTDAQDRNC